MSFGPLSAAPVSATIAARRSTSARSAAQNAMRFSFGAKSALSVMPMYAAPGGGASVAHPPLAAVVALGEPERGQERLVERQRPGHRCDAQVDVPERVSHRRAHAFVPNDDHTSIFVRTRAITSSVNSVVEACPPRSGVRTLDAVASSTLS
jgi:hypothetical protein